MVTAAASLAAAAPANGTISLTATSSTLSNLATGQRAAGSATILATDTSGLWTLQAEDTGSGAGKMVASSTGCTGSASPLANPLRISVSTSLSGVTTNTIDLSSSKQPLASASNVAMLTPATFNANYTQVVPSTQALLNGCIYTITVTYTLQ